MLRFERWKVEHKECVDDRVPACYSVTCERINLPPIKPAAFITESPWHDIFPGKKPTDPPLPATHRTRYNTALTVCLSRCCPRRKFPGNWSNIQNQNVCSSSLPNGYPAFQRKREIQMSILLRKCFTLFYYWLVNGQWYDSRLGYGGYFGKLSRCESAALLELTDSER
jgi:hypothetical protein